MAKRVWMISLISIICSAALGCQHDSEGCTKSAYCDGNTRYYCESGELKSESCAEICSEGACIRTKTCMPAYCDGNERHYCNEPGVMTSVVCSSGCIGGECIEKTCKADYCEGNVRHYCSEAGFMTDEICDEACESGECIHSKTCEAAYCEGKTRYYCDDKGDKKSEVCDEFCIEGECINTNQCIPAYCEENVRYYCGEDSTMTSEICDYKCESGECMDVEPGCGDGIIDDDEQCDDGADNGKYGYCRDNCQSKSKCGDGIVDTPDEVCDEGELNGSDGHCNRDCNGVVGCGNGVIENDEECDPPSEGTLISCDKACKKVPVLFEETPIAGQVTTEMSSSCHQNDLFQKYLYYRERFIGNAEKHIPGFISWGTNPGETLPAEFRDPLMNCSNVYMFNHGKVICDFENIEDAQGGYKWTDTSLWLGIMIHWLATEYRMYQILGLDTTETAKYLAYAIKAFDRLDEDGEKRFGLEAKLDGFFTRDDIPRDFYLKDGHYRFVRADGGVSGYECAASDYSCASYQDMTPVDMLKNGYFVSQDQLTGLYEGFGMAAFLLPDDAEYDGMKLRHESRARIDRIAKYLSKNNWLIGIQTQDGWKQVPETWGGFVQMFSGLFAEAANTICGNAFGTENYHDDASALAKKAVNTVLELAWPTWETNNNYNRNLTFRLMNFTEVWNDQKFMDKSVTSGREVWMLNHALVYGRALPNEFPLWHIATVLEQAPCDGPCSGPACAHPTPGWMGSSYYISPNERFGSIYHDADYNGLDYLTLHNLYFLAYAQKTGRSYTQNVKADIKSKHALQDMIQNKLSSSKYIISENTDDMQMRFCGRPFADWVRDNALGMVDIYYLDQRWTCTMDGECKIAPDSSPYTHRNALILGSERADTIRVPKGYHHCIETFGGDDDIEVDEGVHHIVSGSGNDKIRTNGYQVMIIAGDGDDSIMLGNGYHMVDAGAGNDVVEGGNGTNLINGGAGNDIIHAKGGNNIIRGGAGNDILEADNGDNAVWGEDGDDKIKLGNGDNRVWPGDGRGFVLLGDGSSTIVANEPQDDDLYLCFGTGKNTIWAGWSSKSHCSSAQNSKLNDSCVVDLTSSDCSVSAYENWK